MNLCNVIDSMVCWQRTVLFSRLNTLQFSEGDQQDLPKSIQDKTILLRVSMDKNNPYQFKTPSGSVLSHVSSAIMEDFTVLSWNPYTLEPIADYCRTCTAFPQAFAECLHIQVYSAMAYTFVMSNQTMYTLGKIINKTNEFPSIAKLRRRKNLAMQLHSEKFALHCESRPKQYYIGLKETAKAVCNWLIMQTLGCTDLEPGTECLTPKTNAGLFDIMKKDNNTVEIFGLFEYALQINEDTTKGVIGKHKINIPEHTIPRIQSDVTWIPCSDEELVMTLIPKFLVSAMSERVNQALLSVNETVVEWFTKPLDELEELVGGDYFFNWWECITK